MFKFCSLYSGSSGNCSLIQSDYTKILIDAGESCKKISTALTSINVDPNEIDGILITHEHSDHIKGIATLSKKYDIPIFANKETWDAMKSEKEKISENNISYFNINKKFSINDLEILAFPIPHDAANPCGFNVFHNNTKLSVATDIGHMTSSIVNSLANSSFLMLEANYDPKVLQCSPYPYSLKQRIAGPNGHLSNDMAGQTISYLSKFGLKTAMLGHLSKENNFPELAYKTVVEQLMQNNIDENSLRLSVATRLGVSSIIDVG